MLYGTMSYVRVKGQILMKKKGIRKNDPNSGYYTLPGGKLEPFEIGLSKTDGRLLSIIRETKEETGLKLVNPKLRGTVLFDNSERKFDNWKNPDNFLVYIFGANSYYGELKGEDEEGIPLWVDEKNILSLPKNPGDMKMYEWLKDSRYFAGVIKCKGKELLENESSVDYYFLSHPIM